MPEVMTVFVDPAALLGKQPGQPANVQGFKPTIDLGPSAPHDHDDDDEPVVSAGLGVGLGADTGHYTDVLDQLWPEFDQPEERTAERLQVLFDQVVKQAGRMHTASQDFFASVPFFKIGIEDRARFQVEFTRYLKRLNQYRARLEQLPAKSLDTDSIYVGLVKTRQGAGPVPDAIMHLYFRNQIGVLSDHVDEMSEGFVAAVLDLLASLKRIADEAGEAIDRHAADAAAEARRWRRLIGGTLAVTATAVIGGLILAFRPRPAESPSPSPGSTKG